MALRDVNLVPEALLERRRARRHLAIWGLAALSLLVCCAGGYVGYTQIAFTRLSSRTNEAQERRRLAATVREIREKTEELERLAFVRRVSRAASVTPVLNRLAEILDPQTWLTQFALQMNDSAGARLSLSGVCESNTRLGALIGQLTGEPMFRNVTLKSAAEAAGATGAGDRATNAVLFTIQTDIREEWQP
jgi:Tfp pilus assembly protein PilN